jgi:hypothetical protein
MKRFLLAVSIAAASIATSALAADVSVNIGQPGFYGRLDISDYPPPQVLYRQPILVEQVPINRNPIYLRVPPGHAKHWSKHCHEYNACGERVYFVQDNWYNREYVPRYQEQHRDRKDDRRDESRDDRRGNQNADRQDNDNGHGKNNGKGNGNGNGNGRNR